MPQWRKLHTKIVESEDVNDMPDDFTRLTWAIMPIALDCDGRAQDDASLIRSKLHPKRRDVSLEMIENALSWYAKRGMIIRYEANGRQYFCVPTFGFYQGKTDREAVSVIPEPPARKRRNAPTTRPDSPPSQSGPTHDLVRTESTLDVDSDSEERRGRGDSDSAGAKIARPARKQDPVFDAIAEVCAIDLSIQGAGRSVGSVSVALKKASPPYTAAEILAWGQEQSWRSSPPTVWQLKQGIGAIRKPRKVVTNAVSRRNSPPSSQPNEPEGVAGRLGLG